MLVEQSCDAQTPLPFALALRRRSIGKLCADSVASDAECEIAKLKGAKKTLLKGERAGAKDFLPVELVDERLEFVHWGW